MNGQIAGIIEALSAVRTGVSFPSVRLSLGAELEGKADFRLDSVRLVMHAMTRPILDLPKLSTRAMTDEAVGNAGRGVSGCRYRTQMTNPAFFLVPLGFATTISTSQIFLL